MNQTTEIGKNIWQIVVDMLHSPQISLDQSCPHFFFWMHPTFKMTKSFNQLEVGLGCDTVASS